MARTHSVQHRNRRESKEVELKSEIQELRSQNQQLRRECARLRREYEKLSARNLSTFDDSEPEVQIPEPTKTLVDGCPQGCKIELRRIKTPVNTIVVCPDCKWRKTE